MAGPMWLVALLLAVLAIALAARLISREAQRCRLLQIVGAAPVGIVLIDRDRSIVAVNAGLEKLFGRSREALVGKPIEALIPDLFSGEQRNWFAELIDGGAPRRVLDGNLKGLRGDDSELPIEIELAHAAIDGAPHVVATIVDETDRMRREAAALAAKGAAEASERTKTQFLAHISHEIRTPLHTVIGLTEATLQTSLSATQRDHLRTVLDAGESLLNALDFLDFTRISSGSLELDQIQFDLHDTVRGTLDSLAIRAQDKGLSLSCSIDPLVPVTLIGDPARLRQVLTNLLDNAIRFTAAARSRWRSSWRRPTATDTRSCTSRCATPGRASPRSSSTGSSSRSSRSIHRRCGAVARGSGSRSVSSSSS
jgi:PAS domain S-box-containing protein